jgi:hypothetical protein
VLANINENEQAPYRLESKRYVILAYTTQDELHQALTSYRRTQKDTISARREIKQVMPSTHILKNKIGFLSEWIRQKATPSTYILKKEQMVHSVSRQKPQVTLPKHLPRYMEMEQDILSQFSSYHSHYLQNRIGHYIAK